MGMITRQVGEGVRSTHTTGWVIAHWRDKKLKEHREQMETRPTKKVRLHDVRRFARICTESPDMKAGLQRQAHAATTESGSRPSAGGGWTEGGAGRGMGGGRGVNPSSPWAGNETRATAGSPARPSAETWGAN